MSSQNLIVILQIITSLHTCVRWKFAEKPETGPGFSALLGEHNRPLRVGATHREATKLSEANAEASRPLRWKI